MRIFSLTATEKRLLKIELAGDAELAHTAGCFLIGGKKTGNLRSMATCWFSGAESSALAQRQLQPPRNPEGTLAAAAHSIPCRPV